MLMSPVCAAVERQRPPAWQAAAFLKPSSDDDDSAPPRCDAQAWKKNSSNSSSQAKDSYSSEKPLLGLQRNPGKTVAAPLEGVDAAAATPRSQTLTHICIFCGFKVCSRYHLLPVLDLELYPLKSP